MNLKRVKHLLHAIAAVVLVLCFLMCLLQSAAILIFLLVITLGLCVAGIAVNLVFWRCPYCGEHLDRGGKYCSHCGNHLADLE